GLVRWLGGLLTADARHLHLRLHRLRAAGLAGALLGVTVRPPRPDGADLPARRLVTGASAQRARADRARSRRTGRCKACPRPGPCAAAANRLGDRGDHADLTAAVTVAVPARDLPVTGRS